MRSAIVGVVFLAALSGCSVIDDVVPGNPPPPQAQMVTLSGTVAYRERMALPHDAQVTVRIEDVSLADAPARIIASTTFAAGGRQVPLPFQISYDASLLREGNRYAVSARILDAEGRLMWVTDTFNALPQYGRSVDLRLVRTGG